jgi:hypothetical protein
VVAAVVAAKITKIIQEQISE